jgi:hypothetical protein
MHIKGKVNSKFDNASLKIRKVSIGNIITPLIPYAPATSNNDFHQEIHGVSIFFLL